MVIRRMLALCAVGVLVLAGVASAAANGTYQGKSVVTIAGVKATHPFGLNVKHGKVVDVSLIAGSACADLQGSAGIRANLKINHANHFHGTVKFARFVLKFTGAFKGKVVTGSFTGTAHGISGNCSVPKNTFNGAR
jgi:hypothetical protein